MIPAIYEPVCGKNGKTYSNINALQVEECRLGKEIGVAYIGTCSKFFGQFIVGTLIKT